MITYSDKWDGAQLRIDAPDILRRSRNKIACHNYLFLCAIRIAINAGLDRFIYLESDCRVRGHGWDGEILAEASKFPDMVAAGTPALWDSAQFTPPMRRAVEGYLDEYHQQTGWTVPAFTPRKHIPGRFGCHFIMGAGAVYDTRAMADMFGSYLDSPGRSACGLPPFDLHIGRRVAKTHLTDAITKLPFLTSIFSTWGDKVMNLEQRKELLMSGEVSLVHQVKGSESLI